MAHELVVLVKHAHGLRDADMPGAGTSDPYVKLRIVDAKGHTVAGPKETKVIDNNLNPVWNEEVIFSGLEMPAAYTLRIQVLDKDTLLGMSGGVADALAMDDKLGKADVDLGTLKNTTDWQDMELVVDRQMLGFTKSTLSISLNTRGKWGN